jgi:O-antigen ligase
MGGLPIAARLDRTRLAGLADALVVAVAFALPWSTSATGILLVLWLIALIPTLEWPDVRRELATPAGGLPVLLFALGAIGMAWSDVSWNERWDALDSFWKFLIIPLLMTQFRRSENGHRVFIGFLAGCILLLIASVVLFIWPDLPRGSTDRGVAVKSYIIQSAEFTICAAVLLYMAAHSAISHTRTHATALVVLALAFLADIFFISTSRTTLVVIPALVVIYGVRQFGVKGLAGAILVVLAVAGFVWTTSPYLRHRVTTAFTEAARFETQNAITPTVERTPTGERITFWTKSVGFIESAPWLGHGTGSITEMFRRSAAGHSGARGEVSSNPHNQTFAVGIQLGLSGIASLWAMWIAHLLLFRGPGLIAWIGLVLVTQNVVGSLFNSFLFDFTEGWLYVVGVGVAGGMLRRQLPAARAPDGQPRTSPP